MSQCTSWHAPKRAGNGLRWRLSGRFFLRGHYFDGGEREGRGGGGYQSEHSKTFHDESPYEGYCDL